MTQLKVGDKAPDFSLPNQLGETVTLSEQTGARVLIWFFSRAFGSN